MLIFYVVAHFTLAFLFDNHFIMRKYNELNHLDHAQINVNSDKNETQELSV
jgi:hypothetical protein